MTIKHSVVIIGSMFLVGCTTTPKQGPQTVINTIKHISLTPIGGQQASLTKGKVTIAVTPRITPAKRSMCRKDTEPAYDNTLLGFVSSCPIGGDKKCFKRIDYPCYEQSDDLYFDISIKADIPRPLPLKDSFIAIRLGDETMPYENYQESYDGFKKRVVLPGSRLSFPAKIPFSMEGVSQGETKRLVLGIYDMTIEMNENSETTKRGQFEYSFDLSYTEEQKEEHQVITPMVVTIRK